MQIVEKKKNKELTYELVYDEETIKKLISDIIRDCSIRRRGTARVEAQTLNGAKVIIESATNLNGNKIYENVGPITPEPINDPCDYWRHGDPVWYSFEADILVSPSLVNFLINLLNGKEINYDWFTSRKELNRKKSIEIDIQILDSQINRVSNFDTEIKIKMLQELARKMEQLKNIPDFDYKKLANYYSIVENCIHLELVEEVIIHKRTLIPNKYPKK